MRYDIVTFDCYGTLIDWESGIHQAFLGAGIDVSREALMRAYHEVEPQVESSYLSYRDVLTESSLRVIRNLDRQLGVEKANFLAESLPDWKPFPDTNAALESLRRSGIALGILSNVDDDLLAETLRHFTVDFEVIITAQQVHSYKPAHGHFLSARKHIGSRRWVHAAQSYFHDIVPATELGIPAMWINRKAEQPSGKERPAAEFKTLTEFAGWAVAG